jgi:hypothetical protein
VTSPEGVVTRTKVLRYFEIYDNNSNRVNEVVIRHALYSLAAGKSPSETYWGWTCKFEDTKLNQKAIENREYLIKQKKENIIKSRHLVG